MNGQIKEKEIRDNYLVPFSSTFVFVFSSCGRLFLSVM